MSGGLNSVVVSVFRSFDQVVHQCKPEVAKTLSNPHSRTVVHQRADANSNQRSFTRPSTVNSLLTATNREAEVSADDPTGKFLREISPQPILPDTVDASSFCNFDLDQ